MRRRYWTAILLGAMCLAFWLGSAGEARAQDRQLDRFFYYPYYYFPHNYWPTTGPKWPEPPGAPYMRPPAYMAYPPFKEPQWTYDLWMPHTYYRGFHFWLDQF